MKQHSGSNYHASHITNAAQWCASPTVAYWTLGLFYRSELFVPRVSNHTTLVGAVRPGMRLTLALIMEGSENASSSQSIAFRVYNLSHAADETVADHDIGKRLRK